MKRDGLYDAAFDPRGCADCALPYPGADGARCRRWGVPLPFKDNAPSACSEFEPRAKYTSAPACFACGRDGHYAFECAFFPPRAVIEYALKPIQEKAPPPKRSAIADLLAIQLTERRKRK